MSLSDVYGDSTAEKQCNNQVEYTGCNSDKQIRTYLQETKEARFLQYLYGKSNSSNIGDLMADDLCITQYDKDNKLELSKLEKIVSSYKNNLIKISETRNSDYDQGTKNIFTFLNKVLTIIYKAMNKEPLPNIYDAINDDDAILNIYNVVKDFIDQYKLFITPGSSSPPTTSNIDEYEYYSDYKGYDIRGDSILGRGMMFNANRMLGSGTDNFAYFNSTNWTRHYKTNPVEPIETIYEIYNPPTRSLKGGLLREYYPKSPYHNNNISPQRESRKYLYNSDHSRLNSWHSWITANNLKAKSIGKFNFEDKDIPNPDNTAKRSDFSTFGFHYMEKELEKRFLDLNGANISDGGVGETSCGGGEPSWATSPRYNHLSEPTDYTNFYSYNGEKLDGDYCTDLNGCFNNSLTIRYNAVYRESSVEDQERGGRDLENHSSNEVFMKVVGLVTQGKGESVNQYENTYFETNTDIKIQHLKSRSLPHEPEYKNSFDALANPWTGYSNYEHGSPSPVYGISGVNNSCGEQIYEPDTDGGLPHLIPYADNDGYLIVQGFCSKKGDEDISNCINAGMNEYLSDSEKINITLDSIGSSLDFNSFDKDKAKEFNDDYGLDFVSIGEPEPQNSISLSIDLEYPNIDISKPKLYYYSKGLEDGNIVYEPELEPCCYEPESCEPEPEPCTPLCVTLNKKRKLITSEEYKPLIIITSDAPDGASTMAPSLLIPEINPPVKKYRYSHNETDGPLGKDLYNIHIMYGRPWTTDQQLIDNIKYVEEKYDGLEEGSEKKQIYGLLQLLKSQYYWEGWFAMKEYMDGGKKGEKIIWAKNEEKTDDNTPPTDGWHLNPHLFENDLEKFTDNDYFDNDTMSIYDYDYIYEDDGTDKTLKNIVNEYYNNDDEMLWFYEGSLQENLQSLMSLQNNTGSSQTNSEESNEYEEIVQKLDRLYYRRNYLDYKIKSGSQNFQPSLDNTIHEMDKLSSKLKYLINEPDMSVSEPVYNAYLNKELGMEAELVFLGSEPSYYNDFMGLTSKYPPFAEPCFEPSPDNLSGFNFDRDNFDFDLGFRILNQYNNIEGLECSEPSDGEPSYICPYPGGREALFLGCGDHNIYCHRRENSYGYKQNSLPLKTNINTYETVSCAPGYDLDTSDTSEPYLICEPINGFSEYKLYGCKQEKLLNLYKCNITFKINFTPIDPGDNYYSELTNLIGTINENIAELEEEKIKAIGSCTDDDNDDCSYVCKSSEIQTLINDLNDELDYYSDFSVGGNVQSGIWKSFTHKNTDEDMFKVSFNNFRAGLNGISDGDICYSSNTSDEMTVRNGSDNYSGRVGLGDDLSTDMGCSRDSMYFQLFKTPLVTDQVKIFPYNQNGLLQHVRVGLLVEKKRKKADYTAGSDQMNKFKLKNSYGHLSISHEERKKYYIRSLFTDMNIESSLSDKNYDLRSTSSYEIFSGKFLGCYKKRTGLWRRIEENLPKGEGIRFNEDTGRDDSIYWQGGTGTPKIRNKFHEKNLSRNGNNTLFYDKQLGNLWYGGKGETMPPNKVLSPRGRFVIQPGVDNPTNLSVENVVGEYDDTDNTWIFACISNGTNDIHVLKISERYRPLINPIPGAFGTGSVGSSFGPSTPDTLSAEEIGLLTGTTSGAVDPRSSAVLLSDPDSSTGDIAPDSSAGDIVQSKILIRDAATWSTFAAVSPLALTTEPQSALISDWNSDHAKNLWTNAVSLEDDSYRMTDINWNYIRQPPLQIELNIPSDYQFNETRNWVPRNFTYSNYGGPSNLPNESKLYNEGDMDFRVGRVYVGGSQEASMNTVSGEYGGNITRTRNVNNFINFTSGKPLVTNGEVNDRNRNNVTDNGTILDFNSKWEIHQGIPYDRTNLDDSARASNKKNEFEYVRYGIPFELKTDFDEKPYTLDSNQSEQIAPVATFGMFLGYQMLQPVKGIKLLPCTLGVPKEKANNKHHLLHRGVVDITQNQYGYPIPHWGNGASTSPNDATSMWNKRNYATPGDSTMTPYATTPTFTPVDDDWWIFATIGRGDASVDVKFTGLLEEGGDFNSGYTTGYTIYMFGVRNSERRYASDTDNKTYKTWSTSGGGGHYESSDHPGYIAKFKRIGVRETDGGVDIQPRIPLTAENISKLWNENDYQYLWQRSFNRGPPVGSDELRNMSWKMWPPGTEQDPDYSKKGYTFDYSAMYEDNLLEMLYEGEASGRTQSFGDNDFKAPGYSDDGSYIPDYSKPHKGGSMEIHLEWNKVYNSNQAAHCRYTDIIYDYKSKIGLYSMMDIDHYKGVIDFTTSYSDTEPPKLEDPGTAADDPWIEIDWNPKPEKYVLYSNPKDVLDKYGDNTNGDNSKQETRRENTNHMGQTQGENKIYFTDYSFAGLEVVHENMLIPTFTETESDGDNTKESVNGKTYDRLGSQFILIPGSRVFLPPKEGEEGYDEAEQHEAFFHKNMIKYWYSKEVDIRDSFQIVNLRCLPKWFLDYIITSKDIYQPFYTEWLDKSTDNKYELSVINSSYTPSQIMISGSKPNYGQDDFLYLSSLSYDFNMMDMDIIRELKQNDDEYTSYTDFSKPFYNPNDVDPVNKNKLGYHDDPGSLGCYSFGIPVNFNKEYPTTAGRYYIKGDHKLDIDNSYCLGLTDEATYNDDYCDTPAALDGTAAKYRRLTKATRTKLERELGSWSKDYPSHWMDWIQQCVTIETHPRSNDSNLWTFIPVHEDELCVNTTEISTWGCDAYPNYDIYEGMENIQESQMDDNIQEVISEINNNSLDREINNSSLNREINKSKSLLIIIIFMCLFILILLKRK